MGVKENKIMWLFFALATTFIWGLAELFYKKGARPDEKYAHLKICISVGFVMGLHAVFTLLTKDIGYDPENLIRYLPVSFLYPWPFHFLECASSKNQSLILSRTHLALSYLYFAF